MATFFALRDALEEDPFLGGGPVGVPEADPTVVAYGDTTMARASGLRARPPIAADWREREAERLAREKLDAERLVPSTDMLSRVAERSRDPSMKLIPVANASPTADASEAVASALPPSGPQNPAGKANSGSTPNLPAPSSEGAGGDDELSSLRTRLGLQQAFEGLGSAASGKNLRTDGGVLVDRMKQIEALKAKKAEKVEEQTGFKTANLGFLGGYRDVLAGRDDLLPGFKALEEAASVMPPDKFAKAVRDWSMTPSTIRGKEAGIAKTEAQTKTEEVKPDIARRGIEVKEEDAESKAKKRQQDIALGWARLNAQSAAAARDIASSGASRAEQKDIDGQLENIQKIVKGGSYTPLIASLEQADKAIATLGAPPSAAAQMKHALPGGDRFLSPQEKAYYTSTDKLRQMDQLAVSGKVVSEPERAEFLRQYGASWYASPKAAAAYIDMLRAKTANQLNSDLASVRASPSGQKAIAAYERQPGAVTPMHPVFKGAMAPAPVTERPAKPTTAPAGKAVLWSLAEGKWKAVPAENADAAVASGKYER